MNLPSGLASISARMDDAPNVRGAVAFGRAMSRAADWRGPHVGPVPVAEPIPCAEGEVRVEPFRSIVDRHASLICGSAYKGKDSR